MIFSYELLLEKGGGGSDESFYSHCILFIQGWYTEIQQSEHTGTSLR